jgi:hypothetical protein
MDHNKNFHQYVSLKTLIKLFLSLILRYIQVDEDENDSLTP